MRRSLLCGLLVPMCCYTNFVPRVPVYDSGFFYYLEMSRVR
jgi:hypothetical protein